MTTSSSNPADQARQQKEDLRSKINDLRDAATLKSVIDGFTSLESEVANIPIRIQDLRKRKYAFNGLLEKKADQISARLTERQGEITGKISVQANQLQAALRALEMRFNALGALPSITAIQMLSRETDQFEERCDSAKNAIDAMYSAIEQETGQLSREIRELESAMDKADAASFGFLPGEAVVNAVKTVWCRTGKEQKDDPEGILFLTDQRLLFEQNEEIATKKVLFVTTEREKIQQLLFEVPVVSIENIKAYKAGVMKNQDMLELTLASGCFAREAVLHLDGQNCNEWQKMIGLVKTREIDSDRVIAVDEKAVEKAKSAPVQCPHCGGSITKPVLRGMDSITCEFCGKVIRL